MIEWGQVPSGFELLCSESVGALQEGGAMRIERSFLRMLPETG